jgi:HEAT repeat protein
MAGRAVLVLALVAGAIAMFVWRPEQRSPPEPPWQPTAHLVTALEEGDLSALSELLARKHAGIAAIEERLFESGRGILELVPDEDDPRDRLISGLEAFGQPAEPALVRVLQRLPAKWRRIARALRTIGASSPEAIEALLHQLDEPGDEVAAALVKAGPGAIPGLAAALRDEQRCDRAASVLVALGATAELRAALAPDAPSTSRAAAARALGDARDASAEDALLAMVVEEEDDEIVEAAANGLCGIHAVEPLLEKTRALDDKTPVFQGATDRKSEAFLLIAVRDEGMQRDAFAAFARLQPLPPEVVPLAKKALAGDARREAADALGRGTDDPEVPALLLALAKGDPSPYVRIAAGEAYWRLGGDAQEVIPILVAELPLKADLHHLVGSMKQNAASKALARLGAVAVPALVDALDTDDDFARDQAAEALFQIGRPVHAGERRLRELSASQSVKVSEQAKRLLDWLKSLPDGPGS